MTHISLADNMTQYNKKQLSNCRYDTTLTTSISSTYHDNTIYQPILIPQSLLPLGLCKHYIGPIGADVSMGPDTIVECSCQIALQQSSHHAMSEMSVLYVVQHYLNCCANRGRNIMISIVYHKKAKKKTPVARRLATKTR